MSHADREDKHNYTAVLKRPADISNQIKKEKDTENQAERADRKIRFRKCIFFFKVKRAHPIINPDEFNYFRKLSCSNQVVRRKWQPTPVFLPGECHGQRRLADYSPWDHKELDMTE